jgi:hypothetical protein
MSTPKSAIAFLVLLLMLPTGCAVTRLVAVQTLVPVLDETVESTYRDPDVETVREAIPGNLLLLRGLCESEPKNENLWSLTVQMYFSYALGFVEDNDPARAQLLYSEGLRLGRKGLMRHEWFRKAEAGVPLPDTLAMRKARSKEMPLLFWTVANWVSSIGGNASDPEAVVELPRAQTYLNKVLELDPTYFEGMPHVLAGAVLTIRPKMLGGDPEAGKRHFEAAFRISNRRMLLFQVFYARYYCRQVLDEACFDQTLREVLDAPPDLSRRYRLLNEVARLKARHLMEIRDGLF